MPKEAFLDALGQRLAALPESDRKRSLLYFEEIIDDRVEEGLSEEEAVAGLESVDEIAGRILEEAAVKTEATQVPAAAKTRRFPLWLTILLLVLGSPVWLPLFLAAISVAATVYLSLWIVVASLYITAVSLVLGGIAGIVGAFPAVTVYNVASAVFVAGAGLVSAGLGVLLFFPAAYCSKGLVQWTKWSCAKIGELFTGRRAKK